MVLPFLDGSPGFFEAIFLCDMLLTFLAFILLTFGSCSVLNGYHTSRYVKWSETERFYTDLRKMLHVYKNCWLALFSMPIIYSNFWQAWFVHPARPSRSHRSNFLSHSFHPWILHFNRTKNHWSLSLTKCTSCKRNKSAVQEVIENVPCKVHKTFCLLLGTNEKSDNLPKEVYGDQCWICLP